VRIENRLAERIQVSRGRDPFAAASGTDRLGTVEPNRSGVFPIDEFDGQELRLHIFNADTGERLGMERVRHFPGGEAVVVIGNR